MGAVLAGEGVHRLITGSCNGGLDGWLVHTTEDMPTQYHSTDTACMNGLSSCAEWKDDYECTVHQWSVRW